VEVAKALGGSFKLVMLAPKPVREMTQLPRETQKNGDSIGHFGDESFQSITCTGTDNLTRTTKRQNAQITQNQHDVKTGHS